MLMVSKNVLSEELTLYLLQQKWRWESRGGVRSKSQDLTLVGKARCLGTDRLLRNLWYGNSNSSHGSDFFQVSMYSGHLVVKIQPFGTFNIHEKNVKQEHKWKRKLECFSSLMFFIYLISLEVQISKDFPRKITAFNIRDFSGDWFAHLSCGQF